MHILLIGGGGREHALAYRIAQSQHTTRLTIAPGNAGTLELPLRNGGTATNVPIKPTAIEQLVKLASGDKPDLVVIGPDDPLALGLTDRLEALGLKVFGPSKAAARLEWDKAHAKMIMKQHSIPTAEARIFSRYEDARNYIASRIEGVVLKAAGLAAGKGVSIHEDPADALLQLEKIMPHAKTDDRGQVVTDLKGQPVMVPGIFGDAGKTVVIEEILQGPEVSIFALTDGKSIYVLDPCQDHKRVGEGDSGPNTGGMGAYCPADLLTEKQWQSVYRDILVPTVDAMNLHETPYKGVLYGGLMMTPAGPRVIEFNSRFGDPECQVLMARLQSDVVEMMLAVVNGTVDQLQLKFDPRAAVVIMLCSAGYPGEIQTGLPITGLDRAARADDVLIFHSGTGQTAAGELFTTGGRVLGVTALGDDVDQARQRALAAIEHIHFDGMHYRRDIGTKSGKKKRP